MADNGNFWLDGLYLITKAGLNVRTQAKGYLLSIIGSITSSGVSSYNDLTDVPTEFTPSAHTHVIADITDYVAGNLADGDYGDIVVSSSGTVLTVDAGTITEAKQVLADNTTHNVSTSMHGYVPKAPNNTTQYLRADATWATISTGETQRTIWLDVPSFTGRIGAAATVTGVGSNDRVLAWSFSGTTPQAIQATLKVPDDWASGAFTVKIHYANSGTSANNWVLQMYENRPVLDGDMDNVGSEVTAKDTITPSTTASLLKIHTHSWAPTPGAAGDLISFMAYRLTADAADTNTGAMLVIGISFTYTSSS